MLHVQIFKENFIDGIELCVSRFGVLFPKKKMCYYEE